MFFLATKWNHELSPLPPELERLILQYVCPVTENIVEELKKIYNTSSTTDESSESLLTIHRLKYYLSCKSLWATLDFVVMDRYLQCPNVFATGFFELTEKEKTHNLRLGIGILGDHSVVVTGYDDTKKIVFYQNSWGRNWGNCGHGSFSYKTICTSPFVIRLRAFDSNYY
jgi:C1A family cysteine protease